MSSYSVQALRDKLNRLTNSQESIETLSLWIIHHKQNAASTVSIWFEDLSTCDSVDHQLGLLYVANDVLQNGRRRNAEVFQELFKEPMKEAFKLIRDTKIKHSVTKMMRVWKERKVYTGNFISSLVAVLERKDTEEKKKISVSSASSSSSAEARGAAGRARSLSSGEHGFKASALESVVSSVEKLESELVVKSSNVRHLKFDISDPSLLTRLKDKSEGGQFGQQIDVATHSFEEYSDTLGVEMEKRVELLCTLVECRTATEKKMADNRKLLASYTDILKKAKDIQSQLEARKPDLQRAQSTSTSDPTLAKTDIQEVGDMEIDSGSEGGNEEEAEGSPGGGREEGSDGVVANPAGGESQPFVSQPQPEGAHHHSTTPPASSVLPVPDNVPNTNAMVTGMGPGTVGMQSGTIGMGPGTVGMPSGTVNMGPGTVGMGPGTVAMQGMNPVPGFGYPPGGGGPPNHHMMPQQFPYAAPPGGPYMPHPQGGPFQSPPPLFPGGHGFVHPHHQHQHQHQHHMGAGPAMHPMFGPPHLSDSPQLPSPVGPRGPGSLEPAPLFPPHSQNNSPPKDVKNEEEQTVMRAVKNELDGPSMATEGENKDVEMASGSVAWKAPQKTPIDSRSSLDSTAVAQSQSDTLNPLLQKGSPKESSSDSIASKIGEVLVKSMSTKHSVKNVLDLWMKAKHTDGDVEAPKATDTKPEPSNVASVTAPKKIHTILTVSESGSLTSRTVPLPQSRPVPEGRSRGAESWGDQVDQAEDWDEETQDDYTPPRRPPGPWPPDRPPPFRAFRGHHARPPFRGDRFFRPPPPRPGYYPSPRSAEDLYYRGLPEGRHPHSPYDRPFRGPPPDNRPLRDEPLDDERPFSDPLSDYDRPFRGPPPDDDRPFRGPPPDDDRPFRGPPPVDDRPFRGPPPDDDRSFRGPPPDDDRPFRGPPPDDDRPFRGPPPDDDRPFRGPPYSHFGQFKGSSPARYADEEPTTRNQSPAQHRPPLEDGSCSGLQSDSNPSASPSLHRAGAGVGAGLEPKRDSVVQSSLPGKNPQEPVSVDVGGRLAGSLPNQGNSQTADHKSNDEDKSKPEDPLSCTAAEDVASLSSQYPSGHVPSRWDTPEPDELSSPDESTPVQSTELESAGKGKDAKSKGKKKEKKSKDHHGKKKKDSKKAKDRHGKRKEKEDKEPHSRTEAAGDSVSTRMEEDSDEDSIVWKERDQLVNDYIAKKSREEEMNSFHPPPPQQEMESRETYDNPPPGSKDIAQGDIPQCSPDEDPHAHQAQHRPPGLQERYGQEVEGAQHQHQGEQFWGEEGSERPYSSWQHQSDDRPIRGPPPDDDRPIRGPPPDDDRPFRGPPPDDDRPIRGPPPDDDRPFRGPPPDNDRPIRGPPPDDDRPFRGPPPDDDRPFRGPPPDDDRPFRGPPPDDDQHHYQHHEEDHYRHHHQGEDDWMPPRSPYSGMYEHSPRRGRPRPPPYLRGGPRPPPPHHYGPRSPGYERWHPLGKRSPDWSHDQQPYKRPYL